MRWFWIIISVLIVAAVVALLRSSTEDIATPIIRPTTTPAETPDAMRTLATQSTFINRVDSRTIQLKSRFDVSGTSSTSDPYKIT